MSQIAGDEGLYHAFYRDLTTAAIERDPSYMVVAICRQLRGFRMPGTGIPAFAELERIIAAAGIFDASQYLHQVVTPTLSAWKLDELEGLSDEAERARAKITRTVSALTRIARSMEPAPA
jgi:acyl-[acyl-carrier-protein] desaturase